MNAIILRRIGGIAAGLLLLGLLTAASYWPSLTRHIIRTDLRFYGQQVRSSSLPLMEKFKLLDRIEAISDHIDDGSKLDLGRWQETDEAVRELLGHKLTDDDVALIDREMTRVERRLVD
jgi:hypothetical protein